MVNLVAQQEPFLSRGGQVSKLKGGWMLKHIKVLESVLQQVLQLPGLRKIWGLLGSAGKYISLKEVQAQFQMQLQDTALEGLSYIMDPCLIQA